MLANKLKIVTTLCLLSLVGAAPAAFASDADDLTQLLHEFLAGSAEAAAHEKFWAEELVYTSSRGTRTSKAEIMQSFSDRDSDNSDEPGAVYTAEDIQIQLYGTMAVVAFRLVGTSSAADTDSVVQHYFNTGTFLKRNGIWRVVAWQATIIPAP